MKGTRTSVRDVGNVVTAGGRRRSVQDRDRDGLDVFRGGRANMVEGAWQEVSRKTWDWT